MSFFTQTQHEAIPRRLPAFSMTRWFSQKAQGGEWQSPLGEPHLCARGATQAPEDFQGGEGERRHADHRQGMALHQRPPQLEPEHPPWI